MIRIALLLVAVVLGSVSFAQAQQYNTLTIMKSDGTDRKPFLVEETKFDNQGSPRWSRDGKKVCFDAWSRAAGESNSDAHVLVANADGTDLVDLGDGAMPSFSLDNSQIVFTRYSPNRGVWIMNADGSERKLLDENGWCGVWSPDGKTIAWTQGGQFKLYDVATEETRDLFTDLRYTYIYWNHQWSRDSKQIAFTAYIRQDEGQLFELARVGVDDPENDFMVLLDVKTGQQIAWHPNGTLISFPKYNSQTKTNQIHTMLSLAPSTPVRMEGQDPTKVNDGGSWSPDGEWYIFPSRDKPAPAQ